MEGGTTSESQRWFSIFSTKICSSPCLSLSSPSIADSQVRLFLMITTSHFTIWSSHRCPWSSELYSSRMSISWDQLANKASRLAPYQKAETVASKIPCLLWEEIMFYSLRCQLTSPSNTRSTSTCTGCSLKYISSARKIVSSTTWIFSCGSWKA